jgi:hypothetical protein
LSGGDPGNTRRCPHCGDIQKVSSRRLSLYFGLLGILATMVDIDNTPETERKTESPPKAAKKPPLD